MNDIISDKIIRTFLKSHANKVNEMTYFYFSGNDMIEFANEVMIDNDFIDKTIENIFDTDQLIRYKGMVKAYQDVLDNLCKRELIPEGRDYVLKQRDCFQEKINNIEHGK